MKRVVYIVILLAIAAVVYVFAYPRLSGGTAADAQQTADAGKPADAAAGGGAGGKGGQRGAGGFATSVVVAAAKTETLPINKSVVGYIEPANTVVVRTRADGTIMATNVEEGQTVKAGDVLFKLDDRAAQAMITKDQAQIEKDQANADAAQAALEREQDLVKKQVDPQSSLDVAVAAQKVAQATVVVDNAQLQADQVTLSYMTITAPIAGRVGTVNTSVGNVVHAADTSTDGLVTITQMSPLRVSFSVAESDLDAFRKALGQSKALPVQVLAPGDKTPRATGTLSFIDSSVDTGSGTVVIKADVDNSGGTLWPGQYVTAITQLGAYTNVTTIPLVAVQQSSAGAFVFAIGDDQKAKKVPVNVSATVGETAIIGTELKPGDHVVVEGQLRLADGSTVKETMQGATTNVAATGGNTEATGGAPPATGSAAAPAAAPAGNS